MRELREIPPLYLQMRTQSACHLECRLVESLSRGPSYTVLLTHRNCERKNYVLLYVKSYLNTM